MEIPKSVLRRVRQLVPATLCEEIASFRIVPAFPKSNDKPDIVVTTKSGEFIEIKNRNTVRSCLLELESETEDILLHYNKSLYPNYIVKTKTKVLIVGRDGDDLSVINKFNDVARVLLDDENVCGKARINLWYLDGFMPVLLNEAYEINEGGIFIPPSSPNNENEMGDEKVLSILTEKLSEARLNTASNLKILREKREFRHRISHITIEDTRHDIDAVEDSEDDPIFDKIRLGKIWQRVHDGKWIIGIPLENISNKSIQDIEILLKCENVNVFNYTTSIYTIDESLPLHWKKIQYPLLPKTNITIIAITDSPAFKLSSIINCKCALNYFYEERFYCLPLPDIEIKAIDLVSGVLSPILCPDNNFGFDDVLSLLAVSVVTKFTMNFISSPTTAIMTFLQETLGYVSDFQKLENIFRHNGSSVHILHGTVVSIVHKSIDNQFTAEFVIITRSNNQLLMLINLIYDLFPSRIAIIPSMYEIELKKSKSNTEEKMDFDTDEIDESISIQNDNIFKYGSTVYNQMSFVCNYLQKCIDGMSNSNDQIKSDSSMHINVLSLGNDLYKDFWNEIIKYDKIRNEILRDINML